MPGLMLDDMRLEREARAGFWPNHVLTDYFDAWLNSRPNDTALIAHRTDQGTETRLTYAELDVHVNNIAANLTRMGVQPGDVVSYQLPNRWEFVALLLACIRIGAVSNPLMPIFRRRELEFMVGRVGAKILIVPAIFRNFDHAAMAGKLQPALPALEHVIIVDGQSEQSFAVQLLAAPASQPASNASLTPNQVLKVMYTSGTTGEPKGVMHTSNTLLSTIIALVDRIGVTGKDVMFVPTPFAHSFGFVYGIMLSVHLGIPLVTLDVWKPATAITLMERHGVTFSFGTPPFLSDLAYFPSVRQRKLDNLRLFLASGAPIPRALAREAERNFGLKVEVAFGMTELGIVSATDPARPDLGRDSDGYDLASCETRIVDAERRELPPSSAGSLECRGSSTFVGYHRRPDLYAVDAEGWFDTGDLAKKNAAGCLQIVGRKKDIIIRGGENIPVVEVEKLIHEMPQVREAALVAMPDLRLGERVCAYITTHAGAPLSLTEVVEFLEGRGLARQYLPERLELVEGLPKTPSGKIQKYLLREQAARLTV
jgi:cyclohexanecarboxylate-CoA ligase